MRPDGSDVRELTDSKWEDASAACGADHSPVHRVRRLATVDSRNRF
jgi:hypothetical protein